MKIGIFGAGRGTDLAKNFMMLGCEIVAVCDKIKGERIEWCKKELGADTVIIEDFDEFLKCDMDAVVIANTFHEHTPFVIKCFEKGLHVLCECITSGTMAESVELLRAFEKSNSIFMLAENYPQMLFNREMQRVVKGGTLGKVLYAEGEYNHPVDLFDSSFNKSTVYSIEHWRNFLPRCYYITHSLGPVMRATGATPKKVTAFASFEPFPEDAPVARRVADRAAIITTLNDDDSVFRVTGCAAFGAHHNAYRICGTKGQIENIRGMKNKMLLRYNKWDVPENMEETNFYDAAETDADAEMIAKSGHGGGDYLTARMFLDCIKNGNQPEHPFDIHSAITMTSVALLAHRSMLEGGKPYDIPDFHDEEQRKKYENDRLTPFYGPNGEEPTLPCCSHPDYKPTEKQIEGFLKTLE
ncbi:MAG: Gfo/Idh/MocA family oxidoreductase [Clostridia bacterium]|nr:Gfo/Idh/MocA family oxidoreductase [Clostridia bacterium]